MHVSIYLCASGQLVLGCFAFTPRDLNAITAAAQKGELLGLGIDSWGVDFGLLDSKGELLANPVHYRDERTQGMMEAAFELMPRKDIFQRTGIQFMPLNTIYQLLAMRLSGSPLLDIADKLLMMGELFTFFTGRCGGVHQCHTTQAYDPIEGTWSASCWPLGYPQAALPRDRAPNTHRSSLPQISDTTGRVAVYLPAVPTPLGHRRRPFDGSWRVLHKPAPGH